MIDIDYINEIENKYPVLDWCACGFCVWPILRIHITTQILLRSSQGSGTFGQEATPSILKRLVGLAKGHIDGAVSGIKDKAKNQKITMADFLFVSDQYAKVLINGQWYHRYCDPIRENLYQKGYNSIYFDLSHEYRIPRYNSGIFIQSKLDYIKIKSRLINDKVINTDWEGFDEMLTDIATDWDIYITPKQLYNSINLIRELSKWYMTIINQGMFKACFLTCYYSTEMMALCLACKECGIPVIDIQHGVQGSHRAYSRWLKVPENGYELLPSIFWCWSDFEANNIGVWSRNTGESHHAIVGGNPWFDTYSDFINNGDYDIEINGFKKLIAGYDKVMLICLSGIPDFGIGLDQFLLDIMKHSGNKFLWLVRLHHTEMMYQERIINQIRQLGIENYEIELSCKLPLPLILQYVDMHLTHWSTTALEAAAYNVPTIFLDKKGLEVFNDQINSNLLYFAKDNESLQNAINISISYNKKSFDNQYDGLEVGISRLLSLINL